MEIFVGKNSDLFGIRSKIVPIIFARFIVCIWCRVTKSAHLPMTSLGQPSRCCCVPSNLFFHSFFPSPFHFASPPNALQFSPFFFFIPPLFPYFFRPSCQTSRSILINLAVVLGLLFQKSASFIKSSVLAHFLSGYHKVITVPKKRLPVFPVAIFFLPVFLFALSLPFTLHSSPFCIHITNANQY